MTGEKLSEFQVVAAVQSAQVDAGVRLKSFLLLPTWGETPHYSLLVEADDLADQAAGLRLAAAVERRLQEQNQEYENRRSTLRLGPIRIRGIVPGSWLDFQRRRLARSGGTAEQYKQPCLLPDLEAVHQFRFVDPPAGSLAS
jgi:hypothetical protein